MKCTRSDVTTAIAALPEKFVRYKMFERVVTMSASTPSRAQLARTASWRRLSAALGAYDMNRRQQLFERCECGSSAGSLLLRGGIDDDDGWRFDDGRRSSLLGRLHLTSQLCDGLLEVGIVTRERQRRTVVHQRLFEL